MRSLVLCLLSGLWLTACTAETVTATGKCPDPTHLDLKAALDFKDEAGNGVKDQYVVDVSPYTPGSHKDFVYHVRNGASATSALALQVKSLHIVETMEDGKPVSAPQFECIGPGGKPCAQASWLPLIPAGFDASCAGPGAVASQSFTIRYTRPDTVERRRLEVALTVTGDPAWANTARKFTILLQSGVPRLSCTPPLFDFGQIGLGEAASTTVVCSNLGTDTVRIQRALLQSQSGIPLEVHLGAQVVKVGAPYEGTPPVTIEPGETLVIGVELAKLTVVQPQSATLQLYSNDATKTDGLTTAQFKVNATGPCLNIDGVVGEVNLGKFTIGDSTPAREVQLHSCGTEPVDITSIALAPGSSPDFKVTFEGQCFAGKAPTSTAPVTLDVNEKCSVFVAYTPTQVDAAAKATLVIESTAGQRLVQFAATSSAASCVTACFKVKAAEPDGTMIAVLKSGEAVIPQTMLVLDANCSAAAPPHIAKSFTYTLTQQPQGSYALFKPAAKIVKLAGPVASASLVVNITGKYAIRLDVSDENGTPACQPALFNVTVVPDDKLHIELTWDTPGDPDKTDVGDPSSGTLDGKYVGSDFDLHFAHPNGLAVVKPQNYQNFQEDPFFVDCWDTFLLNTKPSWGEGTGPDDDPHLDLDDKDGWGPENTNIHVPEPGTLYFIGVHDWADNGFGPSIPRVRIYLDGLDTPVLDKTGPSMSNQDFWCVQRVAWSPNQLLVCKGADAQGNLLVHKVKFDYSKPEYGCAK